MRAGLIVLALVLLPSGASAAQWQICDLTVKVLERKAREGTLRVSVQKLEHRSRDARCPSPGEAMEFMPETRDYQAMLPRKRWPQVNETVAMQYRYLDGICHNDGHDGPCRIKHYPMPR